ncbi:bifunctional 3-(3-hydroxy-phenyl)propionate/3-hydroxycinnamic acid hydroxylase MhpA [Planococcus shenhongbingii]|uniref:Bifunctional 3-(3-hydroxy-phenyl)propionate/3-hydroxycinnamic acid hydroxylase n=1 Tax=Planococcus shenhongbingii TaxID=3058398 RepID=A0ABT8NGY7_9BACL|nr:bifunctional 3-(3-hydroxy-phenyl)propionate/3-hydroxycinnamic acid hydroxylase [Planococcus sp. N017]MDN7247167.1 bifunctional 3-(3-hydroxy-phenyl)propionate/3-hydroxycinnamic acid hydroxylase [Planococcus sp. N017]
MTYDYDVAIVGYGPVGKVLALNLASKGWKIGIFEKFPKAYPLPRAIVFDDEIARILQSVCNMEEVIEITADVPDFYEWRNASQEVLLKIDWSLPGISGWPGTNFFSQPDLEAVLDKGCLAQPLIEVNMGHKAMNLVHEEDHVELHVQTQQGVDKEIKARYVVGCDGANSFVRKYMETPVTDLGFMYDWLILDLIPHEERVWSPMNMQLCDPARPTTIASGGPGRRRFEFMRLPGETIDDLKDEAFAWKMLEKWDLNPGNCTLERNAVYTFKAQWAESWREGRLLLAGDSAHLMPPFMGQGMCSGLRDAQNLAWKLDLVLGEKVEEEILDTYTEERKDHVKALIDMSIFLGKVICITDPEEAKQRDEAFFAGNVPPMPDFPNLQSGILDRDSLIPASGPAGNLSMQGQVEFQGTTGLFDDVVGAGWTIISTKSHPERVLSQEEMEFLEQIQGRCVYVSDDSLQQGEVLDRQGAYAQYFKENDCEAMIVRPDFYIFGAAKHLSDLPKLVQKLASKIAVTNDLIVND